MDYLRIPLRNREGKTIAEAVIDSADGPLVDVHRWHRAGSGYAERSIRLPQGTGHRFVLMHREILGLVPGDGFQVDHVNGDRLDNRRANLRVTDAAGNAANLRGPNAANRTSRYRGVSWRKDRRTWSAQAQVGGRKYHLGCYADELAAAEAAAEFRRAHMPTSVMDQKP